jgi:hypothetical protein
VAVTVHWGDPVSDELKPVPVIVMLVPGNAGGRGGEPEAWLMLVIAGSAWKAALAPEVSPWAGVICNV